MNAKRTILGIVVAVLAPSWGFSADLAITRIEPTPLFPRQPEGRPLRQLVRLHLDNPTQPVAATVRITIGTRPPEMLDLGRIAKGKSTVTVQVPDIAKAKLLKVELLRKDGDVLAAKKTDWQPQKKWRIYCVSFSHQDLGFGDYPHRLRTSIRHENIRTPLQLCRQTDDWPDDDKYRFNIETSEPITSFISFNGKHSARELARRLREGRVELGRLHNTANTEELSHELMARLFYMSGRYAVDLLGVPPNKTMQNDDVIGMTWPLATYAAEAGVSNFFHGYNGCGRCELPAESSPVFYWEGPDGGRVLERAMPYGTTDGIGDVAATERHIAQVNAAWPYDALLFEDGNDFQLATRSVADRIHAWNAKWAYPRMVCATMDMFFRAIEEQAKPGQIKTYAADSNNQWSDQDYAAARATGDARRLSEALPATETLASIAQALAGGGDQWIDLFESYHRLLQYFEHTNAKDNPRGNMAWYETELEENREMVAEAAEYQRRVFASATQRLAGVVARNGEKNLVVFNPLPYSRTDIVRGHIPAGGVVDGVTGARTPVQPLPDGTAVFLAQDVPATGYKVFALQADRRDRSNRSDGPLENRFYKIRFDPVTGALTGLFDKTLGVELVEKGGPHAFNEYLYEFRSHTSGLDFSSAWSRMAMAEKVAVDRGPVADVLTVIGKADGVRALKQTVVLYHGLLRIDFQLWLDKAPFRGVHTFPNQHEAMFVALPLAIPSFTVHHELPGCVAEPYRQQFQGSATDHYAVRSFTDLSNDKYGVTISPIEGSLVCYGEPTSSPIFYGHEEHFKRDRTYPAHSRLYLYLLNNMFDVNIAADQRGPVSFQWALRSHAGDWKAGGADRFGRSVLQPLLAWRVDGTNAGPLPAGASFMSVDAPNVTCSVIKPAEANGRGYIIRLNETTGQETTVTVSLPLLPAIESATATSLVEDDRPEKYVIAGSSFKVTIPKFGVKTIRVTCVSSPVTVAEIEARAVADMQVNLSWQPSGKDVSHYNIYRDTLPDCTPTQLNLIGQSATGNFSDQPRMNLGGWLRSCLDPKTTYYYRVVAVDRYNNRGAPSAVAAVTTPSSGQANLPPLAVQGLRAILVSPITNDNFVNLLFRTACEPDVVQYEIYRDGVQVGIVKSDDIPPRSGGYGEQEKKYTVREYDHATSTDRTVAPRTQHRYRVRAVDAAGQKGPFSEEVSVWTKDVSFRTTAQSVYAPEYGPDNAVDGDPDPYHAWISKPYGGGTKANPADVWWAVEFLKKPITIKGVKIIGDHRDVIPLQRSLQLQVRQAGAWKTVGGCKAVVEKDITITFPQSVTTDNLRVFVPSSELPTSDRADVDGIVRIAELLVITPEGLEQAVVEAASR